MIFKNVKTGVKIFSREWEKVISRFFKSFILNYRFLRILLNSIKFYIFI